MQNFITTKVQTVVCARLKSGQVQVSCPAFTREEVVTDAPFSQGVDGKLDYWQQPWRHVVGSYMLTSMPGMEGPMQKQYTKLVENIVTTSMSGIPQDFPRDVYETFIDSTKTV